MADKKIVIIPTYNEKENIENIIRKVFSLEAGFDILIIDNDYSGDANLVSQIHSSNIYAFSQIQGSLGKIGYMIGLGLSREYYRQGETRYDRVWLRPKLNLSLPLSQHIRLNCSIFVYLSLPPALISSIVS